MSRLQQRKVIFFNGPKHSGKDTAVRLILKNNELFRHLKFATPLKNAVKALFSVNDDSFTQLEKIGSTLKDVKSPVFLGDSYREALIALSEDFVKERYGQDAFGKLAVRKMWELTGTAYDVFSDCGFNEELTPVIEAVGKKNCLLIRINRPGHTFEGDSRDYIYRDDIASDDIDNRFDLEMFELQVMKRVRAFIGG